MAFLRPEAPVLSWIYHGLGRDTVCPVKNLGFFFFKDFIYF